MRIYLLVMIAVILVASGGCTATPQSRAYTVYYYTAYDLMDLGNIEETNVLPELYHMAICRVPTHGQAFWEQEFIYADSSKSWVLRDVQMYKVIGDTLCRVDKADQHHMYSDPRDPKQLLIWGKDTIFTPVFFPMQACVEYLPWRGMDVYDSTCTVVLRQQAIENHERKRKLWVRIAGSIRKKLKIEGFWSNYGLKDNYAIRYQGKRDMQVNDSLYRNAHRYSLQHTNPEVFRQYKKITRSFTRDYVLLQESMGWSEDGFVCRELQHKKAPSLPDCVPVGILHGF